MHGGPHQPGGVRSGLLRPALHLQRLRSSLRRSDGCPGGRLRNGGAHVAGLHSCARGPAALDRDGRARHGNWKAYGLMQRTVIALTDSQRALCFHSAYNFVGELSFEVTVSWRACPILDFTCSRPCLIQRPHIRHSMVVVWEVGPTYIATCSLGSGIIHAKAFFNVFDLWVRLYSDGSSEIHGVAYFPALVQ